MAAFTPGATATLTAGTTSSSATIAANAPVVRLINMTGVMVFFRFGTSTATAELTDTPIPSGAIETFSKPYGADKIAVITASGGGAFYCTAGNGE